jgi:hypothetical protein
MEHQLINQEFIALNDRHADSNIQYIEELAVSLQNRGQKEDALALILHVQSREIPDRSHSNSRALFHQVFIVSGGPCAFLCANEMSLDVCEGIRLRPMFTIQDHDCASPNSAPTVFPPRRSRPFHQRERFQLRTEMVFVEGDTVRHLSLRTLTLRKCPGRTPFGSSSCTAQKHTT